MAVAATKKTPDARVLKDGTLMIHGVIGDEFGGLDSATVVEEIRGLEGDAIRVDINSPGGSVFAGISIYQELATNPADVTVDIVVAASMASAIAMAGDTVRIAANGRVMIHDPRMVAPGTAKDLRKAADLLESLGDDLISIYARKTGLDEAKLAEMMDEETWLNAQEALDLGFVDEIVEPMKASAFADLDLSNFAAVPAALTELISEGKRMAKSTTNEPGTVTEPKGQAEPKPQEPTKGAKPSGQATAPDVTSQITAALEAHRKAERDRRTSIDAIRKKYHLPEAWATERFNEGDSGDEAQAKVADALVEAQASGPSGIPGGVGVIRDERDQFVEGATNWLIVKSGRAGLFGPEAKFDPGEFRGMSLMDLARESMARSGVSTRGWSKREIAGGALGLGMPRAQNAGLGTRSDFPILLENVLHKMLQAAYGTIPDTWRFFCAEGSVSDFRPHPRLRLGSFAQLDDLLESGEFKQKHFPDAEKETISATTKGNIVGLTRQAIVNDDVDGFSRLVTMLGRAAALSIEVDVYATLGLNAGLGPDMADTNPLFDAAHSNVGAGVGLGVDALEADRVLMASQTDPEGNEILDLRPWTLVVPIGLGGDARVINDAQYDIDPIDAGTDEANKFMKPNKVRGLFTNIVDTPRLTGTRRYVFANPAIAPVLEVVFLDGQSAPTLQTEEGFDYDGVRWRIVFDYGVGATDFRGAVTDAGQ